ncbi:hypothetical protein [Mesorhizobium sp. B2-4-14]|uniref:hypothetical protein n=1 Tax=Mesorhizobium sp. B2-4-14 TaxID=2589935 RepID=UPI001AEE3DF9|nr:hypothetical protein [Mesorhizobium sp. B2-4-14]
MYPAISICIARRLSHEGSCSLCDITGHHEARDHSANSRSFDPFRLGGCLKGEPIVLKIQCHISGTNSANDHYNWAVLGELVTTCVSMARSLGANLDKGYSVEDMTSSAQRHVRTFVANFHAPDDEFITFYFAFDNTFDKDYEEALVLFPTIDTANLDTHLLLHPLD